ncbi:MAG: MFS transporter [Rhodospirillales bacterium]|jgi:cyanate permease|nr:MFS transporter [Rhodospirillales bacterium]
MNADSHLSAAPEPVAVPHPYRWGVLGGVWLAYFCFGMTTVTMAPLVGVIGADLGLSHARMGTVLGAWQLVYIASALPCGILLDRIGPRRALFLALMAIAASGAFRAAAVGHLSLFLAVAIFGIGGPMISVGAPKLISLWFDGRERGLAMGIYITGPAIGNMTALSLTNSVMIPAFDGDWRMVLLSYAAVVLMAGLAWLAVTAHPAYRAAEGRLAAEPREPQIQAFGRLLRVPAVRVVLVMSVGIFFFNHGLNNWLPEILRSGGMDAATAGFWAAVPTAVGVASSLVVPRLATPPRRLTVLLGLFVAAALATVLLHGTQGPILAGGLVLQGVARGAMMTVAVLTLLEIPEVGSRRAGLAGGLFFSAAEVGGVMGPVSIGLLSSAAGGFDWALAVLTAICVALIGMLALMRRVTTARRIENRN